jgi:hypothetical protein
MIVQKLSRTRIYNEGQKFLSNETLSGRIHVKSHIERGFF